MTSQHREAGDRQVLYVIVCGAGPAIDVETLVGLAKKRWDVCVLTTPNGAGFVDTARLAELTGWPVRASFGEPATYERPWPPPDAIVVAPATINTVCKWAAGIADNLALSILFEAMGLDVPIVVAPNVNPALSRHPAFQHSLELLRAWGVRVLYDRAAAPPVWMAGWDTILATLDGPGA